MKITMAQGLPLEKDDQGRALYHAWLAGRLTPGAREEIEMAVTGGIRKGHPAPLFRTDWAPSWPETLADSTASSLDLLRRGEAEVVITGQQPGRLGGPLYTLFKIATAVELARILTEAGRPAVPVYWSGDDDDDHDEAMAPVCWDPQGGGFLDLPSGPGRKSPDRRHPMVGRLGCRDTVRVESAWLQDRAGQGSAFVAGLAGLWSVAVSEEWSWARLQAEVVGSLFPDDGVVVVSGDDSRLHAAAAPLYGKLIGEHDRWSGLVEESGRKLVARGYHAQIEGRALAHGLFADEGGFRGAAKPGHDPAVLRPGVMYRSPVQDWLLEPAAVVVGPGELAYLKQLEPLYGALGIARSPLVPRLSAWLLPAGSPEPGTEPLPDPGRAPAWAAKAGDRAVAELTTILMDEIGLDPERAAELAAGRGRRFAKGAAAMLRDEALRARSRYREGQPGWVHPGNGRQERVLAMGCALGLWGEDLMEAVGKAAHEHLVLGRNGDWHRYRVDVPDPLKEEGSH